MNRQRSLWKNYRIHLSLFLATLTLIIIPVINKTPSLQVSQQTVVAASEFLWLVDSHEYRQSWKSASGVLKGMLSEEAWSEQVGNIRGVLGPLLERTRDDVVYSHAGRGAPPGEYVIVTFNSKFKFREMVTETITLLLDSHGEWLVVGYFLR